jgi:hypothetical protein
MHSSWSCRLGQIGFIFALVATVVSAGAVAAAPARQGFAPGAVVTLAGTPHIWVADDQGTLHWGGDTRALDGKLIDWGNRLEATVEQIKGFPRGDPWLSAGLLKMGDPIYLVKWESGEPRPRLLHIQSIADVEFFGIDSSNYGTFVIEREPWQQRYGFDASQLPREALPPAAATTGSIRERPVPRGFAADGGDGWRIGVLDVVTNANEAIRAANPANPPPPAGRQYVIVRLRVTRTGETPQSFTGALQVVGASNTVSSSLSRSCGDVPDPLPTTEVAPNARIEGNLCWSVPAADVASLALFYTTTTDPPIPVYFALT